jgi:hypothetical protein
MPQKIIFSFRRLKNYKRDLREKGYPFKCFFSKYTLQVLRADLPAGKN